MLKSEKSGRDFSISKQAYGGRVILKVRILDDKEFCQALQILAESNQVPSEIGYRAGKLHRRIQKELTNVRRDLLALLQKYALKDEKGAIKHFPSGPFEFATQEDEKKHDEEFEAVMDREIDEKITPIPYDSIKSIKTGENTFLLSGAEQVALEPILSFE